MSLAPRTPRQPTPAVQRAPIYRALADWWDAELKKEAAALLSMPEAGPVSLDKARLCQATSLRMRALSLEFAAIEIDTPNDAVLASVFARWLDAQAATKELLPGRSYGA